MSTFGLGSVWHKTFSTNLIACFSLANCKKFLPLTKPTISLLVVVTVIPALIGGEGHIPALSTVFCAILGTYLASNSSAVFNHVIDADIDVKMRRTQDRPVPSGEISQTNAIIFGVILGVISFIVLYFGTTPLSAYIALTANFFYAYIYTSVLKRRTDQNIVIGGAAGAVGPLIGWAAATGTLSWVPWVQFLIIFLWTPPHFWALALKYQTDYRDAGIPMLPVTRGDSTTLSYIFLYTLTLIPTIASLWYFGAAGPIYFIPSTLATFYFVWKAWELKRHDLSNKSRSQSNINLNSMPLFLYSCFYLFIVFGSLAMDRLVVTLSHF